MSEIINRMKKYLNKRSQAHSFIYLTSINNTIKRNLYTIDLTITMILIFIINHWFFPNKSYLYIFFRYSSFIIILVLILNNFILFFYIKKFILRYNLSGKWKGKFIINKSNGKEEIIPINLFEINDFGEKGIIIVETENFESYSIMAKIIQIEENEINVKFIYRVNYRNESMLKNDHYGVTEITFYKNQLIKKTFGHNNKIAEGFYYSYEQNKLRSGKIILNKKVL